MVSLTEYDLHILRALLAMASQEDWAPTSRSFHGLHSAIVDGSLGSSLYNDLHAVTAMVFARMASAAVGEFGRARAKVLRPQYVLCVELATSEPHMHWDNAGKWILMCGWVLCVGSAMEEYGRNGLVVPRYVVAQCAAHTASQAMTGRLAVLQTRRHASHKACCFPLLYGEQGPLRRPALLVMADVSGYAWASLEVLRSTAGELPSLEPLASGGLPPTPAAANPEARESRPATAAGTAVLGLYDSLHLATFGLQAVKVPGEPCAC